MVREDHTEILCLGASCMVRQLGQRVFVVGKARKEIEELDQADILKLGGEKSGNLKNCFLKNCSENNNKNN